MPDAGAVRRFFVWIHRWAGLIMAMFLIVVGLTGSLLAFNAELERLISPQLYAQPRPDTAPLDLATLAERAEALVAPSARIAGLSRFGTDQVVAAVSPRSDPATQKPYEISFDQLFLDPYAGTELGRRMNGDLSQGLINLMPFIYDLHWRLALGTAGFWILGLLAVAWTIDCFIGFYLTLPRTTSGFWRRWMPAWLIKRKAGAFRLNFDLHRAGGLWLWPMLFIFAWSSVMMDMRPVYEWVTSALFNYRSPLPEPHMVTTPNLGWRDAEGKGARLIEEQAALKGFRVEREESLFYNEQFGVYFLSFRSSLDVGERSGATYVALDGDTGQLRALELPSGERSGNTITSWLYALHMANVFGLPYRIFVCVLGLLIVMLSVTGVYIWWKKRRARQFSRTPRGRLTCPEAAETLSRFGDGGRDAPGPNSA
ncbi:Uncharacterized iron-regulated membrane protein [Methylocapsa palsarum]|uniref:Uncharacterized iron-regulated membrane protein n=2 Tax=Methylocapsa palsarum TaxID=1612308 RepID=A0A1I4BKG6_9HYPH|nr:Uncharacterized iron-regulated membrane protein [Methylocapsa palsarum]